MDNQPTRGRSRLGPATGSALRVLSSNWATGLLEQALPASEQVTNFQNGRPSQMRDQVLARGNLCWISRMPAPLLNTHIVPKRSGDLFSPFILTQFCPNVALPTTIFDPMFGITLQAAFDTWFSAYELGLQYVAPNVYECHVFATDIPGHCYTIFGCIPNGSGVTLLHGHRVSPPQPTANDLPPPGLLKWHYMQCVLKHFAHADYLNLPKSCRLAFCGDGSRTTCVC